MSIIGEIIGLVSARGGSKGLPGKNMKILGGETLVARTIRVAKDARRLDRIIVSTDDREIADEALKAGAEVPFMRPPDISGDTTGHWPVWQHAVGAIEEALGITVGAIVEMQPTVPFREVSDIDGAVDLLDESGADGVMSMTTVRKHPAFAMVREIESEIRLYDPGDDDQVVTRQGAGQVYDLNGAIFAFRRDFLLTGTHRFDGKVAGYVMSVERSWDIDTQLDFEIAEFLLSRMG